MSSTYSVKQTHGKQHALRRKISDARGEISRLVGELDALSSKIKQSEARAAEMELLVSNAHSKFATSTTRSLYFSPLQTESRRNHFSSAPTSPTSARSTRRDRHMNAKKEQLTQLSKQLARKQAELDALCEQLEQIEATSLEAASLLPRGGVRSPPLSTRASYRLESELSYISRQRKAKALQPEKRARRRYQRQKMLLEEFDNELPYRRDIEQMLKQRQGNPNQDPLEALTEKLDRLQRSGKGHPVSEVQFSLRPSANPSRAQSMDPIKLPKQLSRSSQCSWGGVS